MLAHSFIHSHESQIVANVLSLDLTFLRSKIAKIGMATTLTRATIEETGIETKCAIE